MATREELEAILQAADQAGDKDVVAQVIGELEKLGKTEATPPPEKSAVKSIAGGVGMGLMDPLVALTQNSAMGNPLRPLADKLWKPVEDRVGVPLTSDSFNNYVTSREKSYQAEREPGLDLSRMAGNMLNPVNWLPPLRAAEGVNLAGALGRSALTGAAQLPLTTPSFNISTPSDFIKDKLEQAGMGAVGGAAGTMLGRAISPVWRRDIQHMKELGVSPTLGQYLGGHANVTEQKATSIAVLGDLIREARNRTLEQANTGLINRTLQQANIPPLERGTIGHEAISQAGDALSEAYQNLLPQLTGSLDNTARTDFASLQRLALLMPRDRADQFNAILQHHVFDRFNPQGNASGETLKEVESLLGREARDFGSTADPDARRMAQGFREAQRILRDMITRQNPSHADQLQPLNRAYAEFLRMENAASRVGSREGVFTPNQLRAASRQMDSSLRKRDFGRGDALLQDEAETIQRTLGNSYPDSGTAGRVGLWQMLSNPKLALVAGTAGLPYTRLGQGAIDFAFSGAPNIRRPMARGATLGGLGALQEYYRQQFSPTEE